jgi:hypothetical protein
MSGTSVVTVPTPASRLDVSGCSSVCGHHIVAVTTSLPHRTDTHTIQVSIGLAASISLFLLSLPHLHRPRGGRPQAEGTGILHIIWLFRNHPELAEMIPQVDGPTNHNLRCAGMVRVAFDDGENTEKDR